MGAFYDFVKDKNVRLVGAEAAGRGVHTIQHAATIARGSKGVFHGMKSLFFKMRKDRLMRFILFPQVLTIRESDRNTPTFMTLAGQNI